MSDALPSPLYVGTRKGLFTFQCQDKASWQVADVSFLGKQVPMLLVDRRDGQVYASVDEGHFGTKLHRRPNTQAEWEEKEPPKYPPKPDHALEICDPVRGTPIPWSLEKIWALEAGGPDEPGRLWAGTIPGGLFTSTDHGETWSLVESLWNREERGEWFGGGYDHPGIHSICVDPRDSAHLLVGISCGGVWRSRDRGEHWELTGPGMGADYMPPELANNPNTQDPHRLVQCRDQPDELWVQHHCAIYRSSNSARSWEVCDQAKPSGFGFAVAVHPRDPQTAWFVPAIKDENRVPVDGKFVVSRTRDGGTSFEILDKGLPAQNAYHLAYRHGLVVDDTGSRLAMGSTTGGLWVSEDGGDSWTKLSGDLPPIFCLNWGI